MIHKIRTSKFSKIIASYLAIQLVVTTVQPSQLFALTSGPSQPEFNAFTPIGTSDMVNLSSGDFNYNIPIMDVGGYPLNLSYDSGITMDQEASWVGLGWNLNVGQINRQLRGLPDDFDGDEITYENNMRTNFTAGINTGIQFPIYGTNPLGDILNLSLGVGMEYNNYDGISFNTTYGTSFDISEQVSAGLNISSSSGGGATVSPTIGLKSKNDDKTNSSKLSTSIGVPFSSRQGLTALNLSATASGSFYNEHRGKDQAYSGGLSRSLSFNDNLAFSPTNKLSFINANLTLDFGIGLEIFGFEGAQGQITGFGSLQLLRNDDKYKKVKGYGYSNTENASPLNSILDFNRENDRTVNKNTTMLPFVNQTYDVYAIQGQGIGGMFRPYRNQVGHVYDQTVTYFGIGGNAGFEIGPGSAVHLGANVKVNPSFTRSGRWEDGTNTQLDKFRIINGGASENIKYEPVHYKTVGELDADVDLFYDSSIISENNPIKMGIGGGEYNRTTEPFYKVKQYDNVDNSINYINKNVQKIKRRQRRARKQSIQMIKYGDVKRGTDGQIKIGNIANILGDENNRVPDHHHVGVKVLKPDGSTYVFGETAYNTKKVEATFAVSGDKKNCLNGTVEYTDSENSRNNSSGRDHYFNKIHTPAYAHTYLLSSVLSSDYEDLTFDGPTDDDLGAYTKFTYTENPLDYKWRIPFGTSRDGFGSLNEGLLADDRDDKASFVYGEKELKYVEKIETKTHIATISFSDRQDGLSAANENGGYGTVKTKKIEKIALYSKPEYIKAIDSGLIPEPIKVAHFEYDYSLCKNVPNNRGDSEIVNGEDINTDNGKLTLKKVYFTYRSSFMGKYTPYEFIYEKDLDGDGTVDNNPNYAIKGFDVWGNYKPLQGECDINGEATTSEFPFVQQDNREEQDIYASSWTMTSIKLPSGGKLDLTYESDAYSHVQNKAAMQMFKVVGAGDDNNSTGGTSLYSGSDDFNYIYIDIDDQIESPEEFRSRYLRDIGSSDANPMYFKFLLNMTDNKYDYVSGYALINKAESVIFEENGSMYGAIRLKRVEKEGGLINSNQLVNPIAKAGWNFGRTHLNRQVYGLPAPEVDEPGDLLAIGQAFVSAIQNVSELFTGPNGALRLRNCAKHFKPKKSWIRLYTPNNEKLGGGIRVKKLELHDNWDSMTGNSNDALYKNYYGQEYIYTNADGTTSGVATFEPNGSKENPLILPFYDKAEKLLAPKEYNYVEKPVGQSLYPSPTVTYGRVVTSNLKREREIPNESGDPSIVTLKKHATGRVINEFYTSREFPTQSDFTDMTPKVDITGILGSILKVRTNKSLTYSQGFIVKTNDMNGKQKSQKVQTEAQTGDDFLSKVEYKYNVNADGSLNNSLNVIDDKGKVKPRTLGVSYDMVHDFRSNYNSSEVLGVDGNLAAILVYIGVIPVPTLLPVVQFHEQELKTVTTTKVIHSSGILKEKIAYDLGSRVSTKNLAWDAKTGEVLLTKTINEYDDHYFNLSYPAHWYYNNMGLASNNLDIEGVLNFDEDNPGHATISSINSSATLPANSVLTKGDELFVTRFVLTPFVNRVTERAWVAGFESGNAILIKSDGSLFPVTQTLIPGIPVTFKVYRSGYRNLPMANMASVTLQNTPINITNVSTGEGEITNQSDWANLNIVNSSAIEYYDAWNTQCEFRLPDPEGVIFNEEGDIENLTSMSFNPYLYNAKGDWRAIKSYAYLAGRNNGTDDFNPRAEGFYKQYTPFYKKGINDDWLIDRANWTFASQVTAYSPYGAELENKDALNRFSAAQYGYRYTLPTAVGSNTQYRELAFDGFEDYDFTPLNGDETALINPHFGYQDEVLENTNASITDQESHSGRNSIEIQAGATAKISHRLVECEDILDVMDDFASNCNLNSGETITINAIDNDIFNNDTVTSIQITTMPNHGSVVIHNNDTPSDFTDDYFIYTIISVSSNDAFTYTICDVNGNCDSATVYVGCEF